MKTLVYSTHGFDKPFLEFATKNKHQLSFSELPLNETTAHLANGFEAVALFTSDNVNETYSGKHNVSITKIVLKNEL